MGLSQFYHGLIIQQWTGCSQRTATHIQAYQPFYIIGVTGTILPFCAERSAYEFGNSEGFLS